MTKEDKQLLLEDLCCRLPFGVMAKYYGMEEEMDCIDTIEAIYTDNPDKPEFVIGQYSLYLGSFKPYLRDLSDMTKQEIEEFMSIPDFVQCFGEKEYCCLLHTNKFVWLNQHHFDYRGLIKKGLAIRVTTDDNPYATN